MEGKNAMTDGTSRGDDLPGSAPSAGQPPAGGPPAGQPPAGELSGTQLAGVGSAADERSSGARAAHIAFMAAPAHGHVNPALGLVAELVERGHRVTFATTREFAPLIADVGAVPVLYETTLPSAENQRRWPEDQRKTTGMFLGETAAALPRIEAQYENDRPDVIVHDTTALQGLILGRRWSVPHVQISATHVWCEELEARFGSVPAAEREAIAEKFDEFLLQQDIDLTFRDIAVPEHALVTVARRFQYGSGPLPECYTFVGPMLSERGAQGAWQAPDERPVVLISMGSAYNDQLDLYRNCLRAFAGLDWHVVLATGGFVAPEELGEIPPNVEVRSWVPQLRILAEADAFITHAGMGGTMEALRHAVPLIAIPQAGDQFPNAERIAELGLGEWLPREEVTTERLREALLRVSQDDAMRNALREMREEILAAGGAGAGADLVERLVAE